MVVSNEPTVVDLVVIVEATANMVAHWNAIKKKYILPTVEYFNGRQPSPDYIGNNCSSRFGYVLYHSYDNESELFTSCSTVTQSPWDFIRSLDTISFIGGGCERYSNIAEGFGRALQVFDDLSEIRGSGKSTKVCLLVCNSPPYDLPCSENYLYAGSNSEKLAQLMGSKGINLSVMSPQHIPEVKQLFLTANFSNSPVLNYAQDPRHLVLLSGFTLPTEQDPIKVEPNDEGAVTKPSAMANNVTATSSVPSPTVQHLSPGSNFSHSNSTTVDSPANLLQPSSSVTQTNLVETKFSPGMSCASTSQISNGLTVSPVINASITGTLASVPGKPQTTMNMAPSNQVNQQKPIVNFTRDVSLPQSVSNTSFSRPLSLNSSVGNVMTSARVAVNSGSTTAKDMLQTSMIQTSSSEAQMRISDMNTFTNPQVNAMRNNNVLTTPTSGAPANSLQPGMFSPESVKNTAMPDQQRMPPQSVTNLGESSIGTSHNITVPPYSLNSNMQSAQMQQKNQLGSVQNNDPLLTFTGSPGNSLQQMNATLSSSQQMINRVNVREPPNMVISDSNQQISNNPMQVDQPQSIANNAGVSRMGTMNAMPGSGQAPNVVVLPNPPSERPLWRGILEWKEKRRVTSGTAERTTHHLQCEVFSRSNQNDDALNVASWPSTLMMQLVPHVVFTYRDMKAQIKNNIAVSLRMTPSDQMAHLANTMQNKWMGVIQTHSVPTPQVENKVILVLYSQKNNHFMGLLPRDPATFISTIRQVIQIHQNHPRQPNPVASQSGQPQPNIDPSQFTQENRIRSIQNQNPFILPQQPNARNPSTLARQMNPMQPQQPRQLSSTSIQVRQSPQMPTGVTSQPQMGFNPPTQRVSANTQMGNPQSMMAQQLQQQNNMGPRIQQSGVGNQQYGMYQQSNMNTRQMVPSRPVMNHNNTDMSRQQQLQRLRFQQQQNQQFGRMNQMSVTHNPGEDQLRALLQGGSSMTQGLNQQRPPIHPTNQGMRQIPQATVRQSYMPNQMRHPMQPNRIMGMQQSRFDSGM